MRHTKNWFWNWCQHCAKTIFSRQFIKSINLAIGTWRTEDTVIVGNMCIIKNSRFWRLQSILEMCVFWEEVTLKVLWRFIQFVWSNISFCLTKYIGQTGRIFRVRYNEYAYSGFSEQQILYCISLKYNQQDATFSRSIYFYKLLYMFQAVPTPIIHTVHTASGIVKPILLLLWMRWNVATIATGSSIGLTIPDAVFPVLCSWWWAEEPPETCKAIHRNK